MFQTRDYRIWKVLILWRFGSSRNHKLYNNRCELDLLRCFKVLGPSASVFCRTTTKKQTPSAPKSQLARFNCIFST